MSKPKVRREWTPGRWSAVAVLWFAPDTSDVAASVWDGGYGWYVWVANYSRCSGVSRDVRSGTCDTIKQAQAAAEASLRAAGYEFEGQQNE